MQAAMVSGMPTHKSIERRVQALEKKFPPRKWNLRLVPLEDLEALERVLGPNSNPNKKLSKRLLRLITKLEADSE